MKGSDLSGLLLLRLGMAVAVMFVAEAYVGLARASSGEGAQTIENQQSNR